MGIGIQICGLNGSGKSTLGRALAEKTGFYFIDNENLFFARTTPDQPYANPRTRAEAEELLLQAVDTHDNFIFSAVKGDYGADILSRYHWVVKIEVPKEIRIQRIRERSFQKFGARMLPGGDLYTAEEAFFQMAASRQEEEIDQWLCTLPCPFLRLDGTKPVAENVQVLLERFAL